MFRSNNLRNCYKSWASQACPTEAAFVDAVYALCEEHYAEGGDRIVECFDPRDIIKTFRGINDVKEYIGLHLEQALNARWGEDTDRELEEHRRGQDWLSAT